MLKINKIYNGDTIEYMKKIDDKSVQLILTSPPYNGSFRKDGFNNKYPTTDTHTDDITDDEYLDWMINVFKEYNRILKDKGVVAFNMCYTKYSPSLPYFLISRIFKETDFLIADTVAWEKNNVTPFPGHPSRLTRKAEFVYIFVKKQHIEDFEANKVVSSVSRTGQKFYKIYYNILKTRNNDGPIKEHRAMFSTDFAKFFVDLYSFPGSIVLDNFIGTGTTALACKLLNRNYIGIDLSKTYCDIAEKRIEKVKEELISRPPPKINI